MAKDPAVLFYTSDFLAGVSDLTMEERGQYITLLCLQHQKGRLTEKSVKLAVNAISPDVLKKFKKDDDGNIYNVRMEEETARRIAYSESRKNNRKNKICKTYDTTYDKDMSNHMSSHMENENENENIIDIKKENEIQKPDEKNYNLELPEITLGAAVQYFKYANKQDVSKETILGLWTVFKNKNFTGQKFYNYTKDIFIHFLNDLKYQKITDGKQATNNHDRQAAIRKRLREKAEALYFAGDQPKDD